MAHNPLLEPPSVLESAQAFSALAKLLLGLWGGPPAAALGTFVEKIVMMGLEHLPADPGPSPSGRAVQPRPAPQPAIASDVEPKRIADVLAYFGILSVEIERRSLVGLLAQSEWSSSPGGLSLMLPGKPLRVSRWFPPSSFPHALDGAELLLEADGAQHCPVLTVPAARLAGALRLPSAPGDRLDESFVSPAYPSEPVTLTAEWLTDTTPLLVQHGVRIRSLGEAPLPGLRLVFSARLGGTPLTHDHLLVAWMGG